MPGSYLWGWDSVNEDWVKCQVDANGKLIIDPSAIFEDTPTDGELEKGPTSNWAYDHNANASAHHDKYTDAEAVDAVEASNNKFTGWQSINREQDNVFLRLYDLTSDDYLYFYLTSTGLFRVMVRDSSASAWRYIFDINPTTGAIAFKTNISLDAGKTVDGTDISAHVADADAHHNDPSDHGRGVAGYDHSSGAVTGDEVYEALSTLVPNDGDTLIASGAVELTTGAYAIVSRIERYDDNDIRIYYLEVTGPNAGRAAYVRAIDDDASDIFDSISLSW